MKRDMAAIIRKVRGSVTAADAADALGLQRDSRGWCRCLWHTDSKPSMKLYDGDRGVYCYACHHSGDVIDMVQAANQCGFWAAVRWLDGAFGLGLDIDKGIGEKAYRAAENARKRELLERRMERQDEMDAYRLYLTEWELVRDLENDKRDYAPKSRDEAWDERFVNALRMLPEAREYAAEAGMDAIGRKAWEKGTLTNRR